MDLPKPHIALIRLNGAVTENSATADGTLLSEALKKAMDDPLAQAVLIEANSPGGSPVQAEILHQTLMSMRDSTHKAIIFSIKEMCASACLYIASAADIVYAHRNSLVGSIGVRMDSWGFDKILQDFDVERRTFTAGKNKAFLDPFLPMNAESKQHLTNHILQPLYGEFKSALREGRGDKLDESNPDLFSGYIWSGNDAKTLGFVDEIKTTFEVREKLRADYQVEELRDYTQKKFSLKNLLTSEFWGEVIAKGLMKVSETQAMALK
jgi:protease-4